MRPLTRRSAWPWALFAATTFAYCFNALKESDVFYHLAAGRYLWETASWPSSDPFSYLAAGAPWVLHEWLAQLLAYATYAIAGYWGLIVAVALLGAGTMLLTAWRGRRPGVPLSLTLALTLMLGGVAYATWIARPQALALALCAALLLLLDGYRQTPRRRILLVIPVLMLLWANLHASFVLGLLLILGHAVAGFVRGERLASSRLLLAGLAASVLALLNPTGYHAFLYGLYVRPAAGALNVMEWKSLLSFPGLPERLSAIAIAGTALFSAWWYGVRRQSRDLASLGMSLAFSALPFVSIRHLAFWVVGGAPLFIAAFGTWAAPRLTAVRPRLLAGAFVAFCTLMLLGRLPDLPRQYFNPYRIPVYAADFLERERVSRVFNLYNEGGYLIWRRYPAEQVSLDGRNETYAGAPLREFLRILAVTPDWQRLVDDRRIEGFFLAYNPASLRKSVEPLARHLRAQGWVPVYWDDLIVIYLRDDAVNRDIIARHGLRHVNPFVDPASVPARDAQAAADELARVVASSPLTEIPLEYARRFLLAQQAARASGTTP